MKAVCIAGWSDSGKTTLIERLIPLLMGRGLSRRRRQDTPTIRFPWINTEATPTAIAAPEPPLWCLPLRTEQPCSIRAP